MEPQPLDALSSHLHELGYDNLALKESGDQPSIIGIIYGADVSNAPKSVPNGKDTTSFATLDNPELLIPDGIRDAVKFYGATVQVHGHVGDDLHVYITQSEQ